MSHSSFDLWTVLIRFFLFRRVKLFNGVCVCVEWIATRSSTGMGTYWTEHISHRTSHVSGEKNIGWTLSFESSGRRSLRDFDLAVLVYRHHVRGIKPFKCTIDQRNLSSIQTMSSFIINQSASSDPACWLCSSLFVLFPLLNLIEYWRTVKSTKQCFTVYSSCMWQYNGLEVNRHDFRP